jgi:hypothetical protein
MQNKKKYLFTLILCLISTIILNAKDASLNIIIVAGQSNALNWHSDASLIDTNIIDGNIKYFYHTGLPPSYGDSIPFNSTSDNQWKTLKTQNQNPYRSLYENFFGPEMTLARNLYLVDSNLAVIKCVYAGSNLALDWKKGIGSGNQLYEVMLSQIRSAEEALVNAGINYNYAGFFWMQGESDASNINYANNYESNLQSFIDNIRSDSNTPNLKFILGRIGINLPAPFIHKNIVRSAQMNISSIDPLVEWVDIDDLPLDTDNVHLLAEGVKVLGVRMAEAWKDITLNSVTKKSKTDDDIILLQNYPNPFNNQTTINYTVPQLSWIELELFDIFGKKVKRLLAEQKPAGSYKYILSDKNLASGVYILKFKSDNFSQAVKILLLK